MTIHDDFGSSLLESAATLYYSKPHVALILSCFIVYVIYYLYDVAKKPILACREGKLKQFLLDSCPVLSQRFWPTLWCIGTHAQTALANLFRGRLPNLPYQREILRLSDGGVVALDWLEANSGNNQNSNKKFQAVALFLPGLTGDSQTEYIKSLVPVAQRMGCRCVVFNNRGITVDLLTPRTYCANNCEDLKEVLSHIKGRFPDCPIFATGVSLGGIITARYLVESGTDSMISAAMLVSVAWDLNAGCYSLGQPGLNLMLNKHLTGHLLEFVKRHEKVFDSNVAGINMEDVLQSKTVRDFDERFTCKIFGFQGADHYYAIASLRGRLHEVKIPTLCINAADDMFAPIHALPYNEATQSSHVAMVITARGGHIGFMEGFLPATPFFSERLYEQYLRGLLRIASEEDLKTHFNT